MDKKSYGDMKFLENFMEFGALYRARVAWSAIRQFRTTPEDQPGLRASLALETLQTCLNSYEDVAIWIQILKKWSSDSGLGILELLDKERSGYPTASRAGSIKAREVSGFPPDFARYWSLPYRDIDDWGQTEERVREGLRREIDTLARLYNIFFFDYGSYSKTGERSFWRAWNKIKHGLFVTHTAGEGSGGTILTVHTDPSDLSKGYELPVVLHELVSLLIRCFVGCLLLGRLLNVLYQFRYHQAPRISWIDRALRLNITEMKPSEIEPILTCSWVERQALVLGSGPREWPIFMGPVLGTNFSSEWWGFSEE